LFFDFLLPLADLRNCGRHLAQVAQALASNRNVQR